MVYWRNIALFLFGVYVIFWVHAPCFLAVYLAKTGLSFFAFLCVPMLFMNGAILYSNSNNIPWAVPFERLFEDLNDLKHVTPEIKCAIRTLKRWRKEELGSYELSNLMSQLSFVDVDTEWISRLIREHRHLESFVEQFSTYYDA